MGTTTDRVAENGKRASLIGSEMLMGAVWKITKARKPFSDWSYDLLIFALALMLLVTGPGAYAVRH